MFDIQHLTTKNTCNILDAFQSPDSAYKCSSKIVAGVCYRLAESYRKMWETRYETEKLRLYTDGAEKQYREHIAFFEDCEYAWRERFYTLLDGDCMTMTREQRRNHRKQSELFTKLLFKHWNAETNDWTFGTVTFS